ncbi:MAG TPA: zinc ribbon domain-containing protein [Ilumatobacter sp.]|nr:zinc ribbon domain-containing protein [Ilumatobacter sp.]
MRCPVCDRPVAAGQRFCTGCGTALTDSDAGEPTSVVTIQPLGDQSTDNDWADPVWAPTGSVPVQPPADVTGQMPATQPLEVAPPEPQLPDESVLTPYDYGGDTTIVTPVESSTAVLPVGYGEPAERRRFEFRVNAVFVLGIAGSLVAMAALFTSVLRIESNRALVPRADVPFGFGTGTWLLDDLADNLSVAGLLAVIAMAVGAVASALGWTWGGGLAGGGGLAFGGVAAIAVGLAQIPIDAAHAYAKIPADPPFTLSITRDLGYHLLIVAAALGLVLFFAAFNDASDHRPGLNPWIAALGGLAVVIATAGPLLPEGRGLFSDNWYLVEAPGEPPAMLLVARMIQLAAFAVAGLIGFLSVRRFGIGLAVGGSLPFIWMAAATLLDLTDHPVGPAFRNPGSSAVDLHGVTVIGVAAVASMLLLAIIAAYDQGVRERTY